MMALRWILHGRVQGVGFRAFTLQCAREEGIAGWVANSRDGTVVVEGEGEVEAIRRFEARLRRGPAMARVERLDTSPREPAGHVGFQIHAVL